MWSTLRDRILPFLPRLPDNILSDNGMEFAAELFKKGLQSYGINHIFSTPYKPSSNGCVERVNRTLTQMLRSMTTGNRDWEDCLAKAVITYNTTKHSEIDMSPSEYLLTKLHSIHDRPIIPVISEVTWRPGNKNFSSYELGQLVKRKLQLQGNTVTNKFQPRYEGPYRVSKVRNNGVTYVITNPDGRSFNAHHSQLAPWKAPPSYLEHEVDAKTSSAGKAAHRRLIGEILMNNSTDDSFSSEYDLNDESYHRLNWSMQQMVNEMDHNISNEDSNAVENKTSVHNIPKMSENLITLPRLEETWDFEDVGESFGEDVDYTDVSNKNETEEFEQWLDSLSSTAVPEDVQTEFGNRLRNYIEKEVESQFQHERYSAGSAMEAVDGVDMVQEEQFLGFDGVEQSEKSEKCGSETALQALLRVKDAYPTPSAVFIESEESTTSGDVNTHAERTATTERPHTRSRGPVNTILF